MTNEHGDYAAKAVEALEGMNPPRPAVTTQVAMAGIKAVTYALLDLASAVRSHAR
jgi:hypothetical protein